MFDGALSQLGGFGSAVLEGFQERGLDASGVRMHAIPDQFIEHSPQVLQRRIFGLDPEGLVARIFELWPDVAAEGVKPAPERATDEGNEKLAEIVSW